MCSSLSWVNRGGCAEAVNLLPIVTAGRPLEPSVSGFMGFECECLPMDRTLIMMAKLLWLSCVRRKPLPIFGGMGNGYVEGRECVYLIASDFLEGGKTKPALQHRSACPASWSSPAPLQSPTPQPLRCPIIPHLY